MKVAQKRKLLSKDKQGNFINNDNFEIWRNRSVIPDEVVAETSISYKETGIIWVEDEEQTKEWLASKIKDVDPKEALKTEYKKLSGEDAKGTWGVKKLTEEISKLKAE